MNTVIPIQENPSFFILWAYAIYIPITVGLTLFVAHRLFKNGLVYMRDIFRGREEIAQSTNQLFKMGFYLLNIGFAFLIMELYVDDWRDVVETLSEKIGGFSIYLGVALFFNLFLFFRGKKAAKQQAPALKD